MSWLDELARELEPLGIRGGLRRRILLELEDHLRCDPGSQVRLGEPAALARQFADELATSTSRRAALRSFAVLVPTGIGFGACWIAGALAGSPDIFSAETVPLGMLAALGMVLAPQVALAAGLLALLGGIRTRHTAVVPAAEAALLVRRSLIALAAGAASLIALALYAVEYRAALAGWWTATALIVAAVLSVPLGLAWVRARRAALIRSSTRGEAGDVFDDLHLPVARRPWALCAAFALLVALAAGIGGGADEGPRNAVFEVLAIAGGFVALGRPLGLRR